MLSVDASSQITSKILPSLCTVWTQVKPEFHAGASLTHMASLCPLCAVFVGERTASATAAASDSAAQSASLIREVRSVSAETVGTSPTAPKIRVFFSGTFFSRVTLFFFFHLIKVPNS